MPSARTHRKHVSLPPAGDLFSVRIFLQVISQRPSSLTLFAFRTVEK